MWKSELAAALLLTLSVSTLHAKDYGLGRPATPGEIAAWDTDVRPDGLGLPKGKGTAAEGESLYEAQCASCHGSFGESNDYMAIAGGVGSLKSNAPLRTVGSKLDYATTLWDYIQRAMPFPTPKSLTADQTYAITAYVLYLSEIVPLDAVLDQDTLPKVKMPNRDGFTLNHGLGTRLGKPDVKNTACMKDCEKVVKVVSQLPDGFTAQMYGDLSQDFRGLANMRKVSAADDKPTAPLAVSPAKLAAQYACSACHGVASKVVGPGLREIAAKYKGEADAEAKLLAKLIAGGAGVWGSMPMPPQAHVPEADRKTLIHWILAGAPD